MSGVTAGYDRAGRAPYVGLPTAAAGCAFQADLDSPFCGAPPTVHLRVLSEAWGDVSLDSCDAHAGIARAAGQLVDEHPYEPDCLPSVGCWRG